MALPLVSITLLSTLFWAVQVLVTTGCAVFVTSNCCPVQPAVQLGLKLPKLGAVTSSPGFTLRVMTPPLMEHVSAEFTDEPLSVHTPSPGAVRVQSGPSVPSCRVTVALPFVKSATENDTHPLSSVCVARPFPLSPTTPVAVSGQCAIKGSPASWMPLSF